MTKTNTIIAIDGFSSCGKSTLAKAIAKRLGYVYVDSGAMYRAVTLYFLRNGIDLQNEEQIEEALQHIHIDMHFENGKVQVILNDEDVSDEIRQMHVSDQVSEVSTIKRVREAMVAQQQALGRRKNVVMDGRDIGTKVFPDASLKLFMTADPKIRAQRRFEELRAKGEVYTYEEVIENLAHRDHIDSTRKESPLVQAEDAILLDNSHLSEEEQLAFALKLLEQKTANHAG